MKGVTYSSRDNLFRVTLTHNKKTFYSGSFKELAAAEKMCRKKRKELNAIKDAAPKQPQFTKSTDLTYAIAAKYFKYNPKSGKITRKITLHSRWVKGDEVGSKNTEGYLVTSFGGWQYKIHRLAWLLYYKHNPKLDLDHKNGVRDDNRISNLRQAKPYQNIANTVGSLTKKSKLPKGVFKNKITGRYTARLQHKGIRHHLGYFDSIKAAKKAYDKLSIKLNKEFSAVGRVQ